ncbi:MAG: hypothetical protein R2845_01765 [Thermomicrobiales bacterium]
MLDVGTDLGIVRKSGAWFCLDEDRLGQGRENAKGSQRAQSGHPQAIRTKIKAA